MKTQNFPRVTCPADLLVAMTDRERRALISHRVGPRGAVTVHADGQGGTDTRSWTMDPERGWVRE